MKTKNSSLIIRRITQTIVFILFVYIIFATRHPLKGFVNPAIFFQIDPFVMLITSIAERLLLAGLALSLLTLVLTFIFGRAFCGWICPLGAIMDFVSWIKERGYKLLKKKVVYIESVNKFKITKYVILGFIFVFSIFGIQLAWMFDPITIFMRTFSFIIHPLIINSLEEIFKFALKSTNFWLPLEMFYYNLKMNYLGNINPAFPHYSAVLIFFIVLIGLVFYKRRFWCRFVCPLGAVLALISKFSLFTRKVKNCTSGCSLCKNICRMGAIRKDSSYLKEECILCMDCTNICPGQKSEFSFRKPDKPVDSNRKQFLLILAGSILSLAGFRNRHRRKHGKGVVPQRPVIRPPGSLKEEEFIQRCIRCGNCMKVCSTNVLQPDILESGFGGFWTPKFNVNIGYCEFGCNLCGKVCPTHAIEFLTVEQKKKVKIGVAKVDRDKCLPWSEGKECLVCEEHCPIPEKAIKTKKVKGLKTAFVEAPVVDRYLCIGCSICENKCPVRPKRAINVTPL